MKTQRRFQCRRTHRAADGHTSVPSVTCLRSIADWRERGGTPERAAPQGSPELRGARSPAALADQGDRTGLPGGSRCGHAGGQVGNRGTKRSGNLPRSPCWQVLEPRPKVGVERGGRLWGPRSRPHGIAHSVGSAQARLRVPPSR